jgi:hypothetical protein
MPAAAAPDINAATAIIAWANISGADIVRTIITRRIIPRARPKTATAGDHNRAQQERPLKLFKGFFLHMSPRKSRSRSRFGPAVALVPVAIAAVVVTSMVIATVIIAAVVAIASSPAPKTATAGNRDRQQQKRPLQYLKRFFIHECLPPVYRLK